MTIIAKSGHVTSFLDITVWIPEDRLDIQLSDDRLSRIKNWRVSGSKKRLGLFSVVASLVNLVSVPVVLNMAQYTSVYTCI